MVKAFLKFIRLPNLIIVGLTQYLLLHILLLPFLQAGNISPSLDGWHFFLFVLDTVLVTLSGNIINDIVDEPIDRINRPDTVFVNRYISIQQAYWTYVAVVASGFILAAYLAVYINKLPLLGIYPIAVGLLYLYSTQFKQRVLVGNLIVSLFSGGVSAMILFAERDAYFQLSDTLRNTTWWTFFVYSMFGFFTTLFREIVKDLEDIKGDAEQGCRTLPIVWGVPPTRLFATSIGILLIGLVFVVSHYFWQEGLAWWHWLSPIVFIALPMCYLVYALQNANTPPQFHRISSGMKLVMLAGLLYLLLV